MKNVTCPLCGNEKDFVLKMPITIVGPDNQVFERLGYHSNGESMGICVDCLTYEAEETL